MTGWDPIIGGGMVVHITLAEGSLIYDGGAYGVFQMAPMSETEFIVGLMRLVFAVDEAGAVTGYRIFGSGLDLHGERLVE